MTGTWQLLRLVLRRDRVLLPLWAVILGLLPALYVSSFRELFPTTKDLQVYADLSRANAGFVGLYGPLDGASLGEIVAWRSGFLPVVVGLFSLLTVIRHTRANEEAGRTDLLGAGVTGRHAGLAAALAATLGANALLALVIASTLLAQGMPAPGSVLLALQYALAGAVFAGVGAVAAQAGQTARTARFLAVGGLATAYVLRLAGDVSALGNSSLAWLSWLSPVGWLHRTFPYGQNAWWPALLALALTAVLLAAAAVLQARRDVGAGLLAPRLGPATAAPSLRGPLGLAWRLHRGVLAGWVLGFALLGLVFGGVAQSVAALTTDNAGLARVFERMGGASAISDSFLASVLGLMGIFAAAFAVQAALRARDEEETGHAELVLATRTGRLRWLGSHVLFAGAGPAAALLAGGLTCGLMAGDAGGVLAGAAVQVPAAATLGAVAVLMIGALPRQAPAAWGVVAACFLLMLAGAVLGLDQWVLDLSPFTHTPHLPGGEARATPLVALSLVAVLLATAGVAAFRRRDVPAG
ncbi:ABC transporter permease [Symbioplanes lichenis]|uniref:ABC transporter permease n=1 Tax=Symbioplanes lichenis TaxID=1629072 RepID=UPI0027387938|nr:ABC transporter permease [Actinoplanes lichenis]